MLLPIRSTSIIVEGKCLCLIQVGECCFLNWHYGSWLLESEKIKSSAYAYVKRVINYFKSCLSQTYDHTHLISLEN